MSKDSPDQKVIATELQEAVPDHTHSRKTALIGKGLRQSFGLSPERILLSKDCPDQKGIATGEDPVIADTSNRSKDNLDQKGIATHRTDVVSDGFFNVFCLLVTKK